MNIINCDNNSEKDVLSLVEVDAVKIERAQNEKKISSCEDLHLGDHLVLVFNEADYFHSILVNIESIDGATAILEIIFYNNDKLSKNLQELISNFIFQESTNETKEECKPVVNFTVQKLKLFYDSNNCIFEIYKVLYDEPCLNVLETIDKATKLVGESKYNVFENNDEHFCIFCKTGKAGKLFLIDTSEIDTKEVFGSTTMYEKIKNTLRKTGTNVVLFNVAQRIASRFPRSILASSLPTILKKGTPLLGLGLEGLEITNAIHTKYKETKEGKLTDIKFKKFVLKRVARSTMGIAGGIVGGGLGQMFIPVPVLGAMVGGFVGGMVGSAIGYAQGILIGEVVENIDYKLHELLRNVTAENVHVLENNVLNIDDVNESDFVIVNEDDCIDINENLKQINGEIINHEDYDIYLLDNNNKTISINLLIKKPKID